MGLDGPSFGKERAQTVEEMTKVTTQETSMPEKVAVSTVSEDAAKAAWLSKLDQPKLGVVSEAAAKAKWLNKVVAVAPKKELVSVSSEDAAKQRWLASIEK